MDLFSSEQIKGKRDPHIFGVGDVEDSLSYEGVASLGFGVRGIDVLQHRECPLIQLCYKDA